jgi:histidine triad (HIT) family protein
MDCIFCKIVAGEIPAKLLYQDDKIIAFDDINPQAPQHKIIIPREHIATLNDLNKGNVSIVSDMTLAARQLASELGMAEKGYRLVMNCNAAGGQTVFHIHMHLIGGRSMTWPPG